MLGSPWSLASSSTEAHRCCAQGGESQAHRGCLVNPAGAAWSHWIRFALYSGYLCFFFPWNLGGVSSSSSWGCFFEHPSIYERFFFIPGGFSGFLHQIFVRMRTDLWGYEWTHARTPNWEGLTWLWFWKTRVEVIIFRGGKEMGATGIFCRWDEGVDSDIVFDLLMNSGMGTAYHIAEATMDTDWDDLFPRFLLSSEPPTDH